MNARIGDLGGKGALGQRKQNVVSQAVRDSARGEDCTLRLGGCNFDTATTVFCHIRHFGWAGISEKPDDFLGFYACSHCHRVFDSGEGWGWEDVTRALGETLRKLSWKGLLVLK